jgi:hypothetical protein
MTNPPPIQGYGGDAPAEDRALRGTAFGPRVSALVSSMGTWEMMAKVRKRYSRYCVKAIRKYRRSDAFVAIANSGASVRGTKAAKQSNEYLRFAYRLRFTNEFARAITPRRR